MYDPDKVIWFHTEDRMIHPYEALKHMVAGRAELFFDGVVCYNDQIAIEAIRALHDCGVKVPQDVLVTGFEKNNLP
jgi:GntR family transcriptional regulator of arabinose operon